ncbi:hypothetical protein BKA58DRAFT_29064 [Alternaria rosae]|uniref:uncharacterized protein n=1 Tax=Alternaria rosae TaxID=1187941 RepID=UPI001E8EEC2F|nr:uncharacterized protein BKA58DRAFT_29064 [Alternaria rosae]KAH6883044.1 hypothetical protein BKA58DRAFT_29064 [Alternaria rosae]
MHSQASYHMCLTNSDIQALISLLVPDELITLTQLCQTLHGHIRMDDASAKANLLSKTLCSGFGSFVRMSTHCPCPAKTFHSVMVCPRGGFGAESHPCTGCGVNTCDECRIHVFYNFMTDDSGLDQRRWWAGYYFLNPTAVAVYPPKNSDGSVWHLPVKEMLPRHDQGRVHIPLEIGALGDPEPIEPILDLDLGIHQFISPRGRTQYPYSGNNIVSFLDLTVNKRKDLACPSCYLERQNQGVVPCSCTLRKRFLDRWLCMHCYIGEITVDEQLRCHVPIAAEVGQGHIHVCGCGTEFTPDIRPKVMCNWCKGEIEGLKQSAEGDATSENDEDKTGEEEELGDGDDEEDHSAADFAGLPLNEFGFAENRDGSLSVYVNGECIRGERLGRAIIRQWMTIQGEHVECTCCICDEKDSMHAHAGDGAEDEDDDVEGLGDMNKEMEDGDDDDDADLPDLEDVESAAGFEDPWGLD